MYKIVVISDTHIVDTADQLPQQLLNEIRGSDMVIHAGDFVSPKFLDVLRSICKDVHAVWGNMDSQEIKEKLPEKEIIKVGKFKIGVAHGCGAPNKVSDYVSNIFKNDAVDVIVFGHSHAALNENRKGVVLFNPGSPTDKIYAEYNSYGVIEINGKINTRIVKI